MSAASRFHVHGHQIIRPPELHVLRTAVGTLTGLAQGVKMILRYLVCICIALEGCNVKDVM